MRRQIVWMRMSAKVLGEGQDLTMVVKRILMPVVLPYCALSQQEVLNASLSDQINQPSPI